MTGVMDYGDCIVITVNDDLRKIKKDIKCKWAMLLKHMKYFEHYLKKENSVDLIDISIQCDIKIFDWLLRFADFNQNYLDFENHTSNYKLNY